MSDLCSPPFSWRLVYYITSACLCQEVFQKFFKLFCSLFVEVRARSSSLAGLLLLWSSPFSWRPLYYITAASVCQEVLQSFLKNFFLTARPGLCGAVSSTAPRLYHISLHLVKPFLQLSLPFFDFFRFPPKNQGRTYIGTPLVNTIYGFWSLG